ncbi:hypothetical protein Poli38472_001314 [Pythium oligandrum]|uniref:Enoyl reductase (ER) domain-containing protein n=1 Tax=Pythium oligandrum TaxID=41045 RepID=A0A8K1CVS7_PYTOL|nr:hypothetical protein Poli38472_001314 [Pythium oligandrum]|eukprot:TMW69158.1 hypothetical protein Poli38472_001314 [Pythium oligandrum]
MVASVPATYRAFQYVEFGITEDKLFVNNQTTQETLSNTQVRIRVHSASVNPVDWKILEWTGAMFGLRLLPTKEEPFGIGFDTAGIIVEVGADVKTLTVGDAVYSMTPLGKFGSIRDYVTIEEEYVAPKPASLSFDEAASLPLAALTSWSVLAQYAKVQKGERVLILGGSGGTGTLGIQLAKALGAYVIATTSARNVELVKSLGANEVIDYTTQKWGDVVDAHSIDVLYDCGVEPASWNYDAQRVLKHNTGRFITTFPPDEPIIDSPIGATYEHIINEASGEGLRRITEFVEKKQLVPVIDSVYPFEQTVDALAELKKGHARGKIVIQISNDEH